MVSITARGLTKSFDDVVAVQDVDLTVAPGEFLVLLGPTGCGKTTLLRLLAGFEAPTAGTVLFDGVPVIDIEPRERDIAMVFQNYALYPHLTVAQNIGFPLRAAAGPATDIAGRVADVAGLVGIADLLNRLPEHLSGGQQQRVAMARALVRRPSVFLLDEPLSNVDAGARAALRGEIVALARRLAVTTVYVTHDQTEAMSMADRVAVLRLGVLQQVGPPAEVYADPDTLFVAAFLGMPRTSLLEAAVYAEGGRVVLDLGSQVLELPPDDPRTARLGEHHTERVTLVLRALPLEPRGMSLRGTVREVENLGHELLAHVDVGGVPSIRLDAPRRQSRPVAASTPYGFYPAYDLVDAPPMGEVMVRVPVPARVAVGDQLEVGVGPADLLLFDGTGRRIRFAEDRALDKNS
jgi:multiple sugar transport system ATP-binding protein